MDSENVTTLRSSRCGAPDDPNCFIQSLPDVTYTNGDCEITVNMTVTQCGFGTLAEYYFEDDGVSIVTNGECDMLEEDIELAYDNFIFNSMSILLSEEGLDCNNGFYASSIQVKNECTRLCEGPGTVGEETSYRWVKCADEQGCCITTKNWCYVDGSFLVSTDGETTDFTIGCIPNSPNCNPTDDPFQAFVPCGGRCD